MKSPKIAQKSPYVQELKAGTYYHCSCGESANQPFCDGSHKGSDFTPIKVELTEDKRVALCGCKYSANGAFCDGAHKKL